MEPTPSTTTAVPSFSSAVPCLPSSPQLNIQRIGLVSRNYHHDYGNGYKDFSASYGPVLHYLDEAGCDAVLFSLYSFIPRKHFEVFEDLTLSHVKAIFLEEFVFDDGKRVAGAYVVGVNNGSGWQQHVVRQAFGSLSKKPVKAIHQFVQQEFVQERLLGNCCLIICGESNGVKYSPDRQCIEDSFGLRSAIPASVTIVLNPIHDRMTRFEMMRKRRFLSENHRWVISVWNKGRINSRGQIRDGSDPAWTVFHNGKPVNVPAIPNPWDVEMGILQTTAE